MNRGGVVVEVNGLRGFIPLSRLSPDRLQAIERQEDQIGLPIAAKVIQVCHWIAALSCINAHHQQCTDALLLCCQLAFDLVEAGRYPCHSHKCQEHPAGQPLAAKLSRHATRSASSVFVPSIISAGTPAVSSASSCSQHQN